LNLFVLTRCKVILSYDPRSQLELPRNMFHEKLWREIIVLLEICFEVVLVKSDAILSKSSKIESLMGTSIEYPFRTKQKISRHNPSVPSRLRGGPTRGVELYFEINRFWAGTLGSARVIGGSIHCN
jgi:hypothetical protein